VQFRDNQSMQTQPHSIWWLRTTAFLTAGLVASSVAYWVLRWIAVRPYQPAAPISSSKAEVIDTSRVSRLLGGGEQSVVNIPVATLASRFKLLGVLAKTPEGGYALISTDGQPAKSYRVGATITDSVILKSVASRSAVLAEGKDTSPLTTLEMPSSATKE
jgi:general secretion pathway protein C